MYDTRWPRPGPAMAAVVAVLGLVAGVALGLSSVATAPRAPAGAAPATSAAGPTTTTLPEAFHTVILGSFDNRAHASKRLRWVRDQGVDDAGLLDREHYNLDVEYAIYSGQFPTRDEARAHMEVLDGLGLGITDRFVKHVTRSA
jgi:hypothetical protein